jgi:hypothetical protein
MTRVEDLKEAAAFNGALHFTAHISCGRGVSHTRRDLATYDDAVKAARDLELEYSTQGRRAIVYGVCAGNFSVVCTPALVALAQQLRENPCPLP